VPLEGVAEGETMLVPNRGVESGEAELPGAGVLGCVFVSFLGEVGLDMVGFVTFQEISHRAVRRLRVLGLWLGRSRSMEELMIPFLCACLI
jgi:hypothetical protein